MMERLTGDDLAQRIALLESLPLHGEALTWQQDIERTERDFPALHEEAVRLCDHYREEGS